MSDTPEVSTESVKKVAKPKLETVVNCNKSGGYITDTHGKRCAPGESCELPLEVCERLVLSGVARYPAKADS